MHEPSYFLPTPLQPHQESTRVIYNETFSNTVILQAADNTSFLLSYHLQPIFNRLLLLFSVIYGAQIVLACLASMVNNVLTILLKYPIVGQRGCKNKSPLC